MFPGEGVAYSRNRRLNVYVVYANTLGLRTRTSERITHIFPTDNDAR